MKRAFTLIEVLVVIAIIALVAALLFPVLASAKNRAKAVTCTSNLRQYGAAIQLYQGDADGQLPVGKITKYRSSLGNGAFTEWHYNRDMIDPLVQYGGGDIAFRCPQIDHLFVQRWVLHVPTKEGESRIQVSQPNMVLAECHHHLTKGWSGSNYSQSYVTSPVTERDGFHLVLYGDGSVGRVHAHKVKQFQFVEVNGQEEWKDCDEVDICEFPMDVFPGEIWPPEWRKLPEDVTIDWGRRE